MPSASPSKSLGAAYALLLTFGYLGAHRFYLERPVSGTLQAGLSLAGIVMFFILLGDFYDAALSVLGGNFAPESAILEGQMSEGQRRVGWAAAGCFGGMLAWLAGDFLTMPFWKKTGG